MKLKSQITSRCYMIGVFFCLAQLWTASNGLQCFSCWRFHCVESLDGCKEMRHFPFANTQTREVSENWRTSPECPTHSDDLYLSRKYVQNCTEEETACGSYFIKVTAAIARNSIGETEYPILVTPNYYHSTIVALGCVRLGKPEDKKDGKETEKTTTTLATSQVNSTNISSSTIRTTTATTAILLNSTIVVENKNVTKNDTSINIYNNVTATTTATTEIELNKNVTKVVHNETQSGDAKKNDSNSSNSTKEEVSPVEDKTKSVSVAPPPLSLPLTHHLMEARDGHQYEYETDAKSPVIPLENQRSLRKCNILFSHVENRTSYGTLERINMTAEFSVCSQCNMSLCNSAYPQDDSAHIYPSSSSFVPSSTSPSTTMSTSSASSIHPFSHQYCSKSNLYTMSLVIVILVTFVLGFH